MKQYYERKKDRPLYGVIKAAKARAKANNLAFNLNDKILGVPEYCPYLGIKLVLTNTFASPDSPSIDRIIPELGYVMGNVQVISQLANRMKSNATEEQLVKFAESVLQIHKK